MQIRSAALAFAIVLSPAVVLCAAEPTGAKAPNAAALERVDYARDIAPLVTRYCIACHGEKQQIAGIGFHTYRNQESVLQGRKVWEQVARNLQSGQMPPKNTPQPTEKERTLLVQWIEHQLAKVDCGVQDPGRVTMRRLNRAEYNNTVRDLLGVDFRPADDFPSDDVGYGFDNIGDVLSISPILLEKYLAAAEKVTEAAIVTPDPVGPTRRLEGIALQGAGSNHEGSSRILPSTGEAFAEVQFAGDGEYVVRIRAAGQQAGPEPVRVAVRLDGNDITTLDVKAAEGAPEQYEVRLQGAAGKRRVGVAFLNDYYMPQHPDPKLRGDRNFLLESIEVIGPLRKRSAQELPEGHRRLFEGVTVEPGKHQEAAATIMRRFATRAYRRPVTDAEVARLVRHVDLAVKHGDSFERGIQLAVQAALVSPHFLFRVELDGEPNNAQATRQLNDWELASRLSYFLWSSMPDDELFQLAEQGALQRPKVLQAQVSRMLRDPRSRAFVENFAGQWLQLRNLQNVSPDPARFPEFDDELRQAMRRETELFFEAVLRENRSALDFLDGKFTFLNERLARHYGINWVKGDHFRKVVLRDDRRGGVLSQASVLTITSNPTRTSPVKRGKWVLEQILGTPPPPPIPGVEELPDEGVMLTGTLRQKMEQHRENPTCASCHARMDPIGFGLENYDAIGAWREKEGEFPIDASGELPGASRFNGPEELKQILKKDKELFVRNLTTQIMTYALGRGLEYYDSCVVNEISDRVAANGYRMQSIIHEVVQSDPFRMRRGDGDH